MLPKLVAYFSAHAGLALIGPFVVLLLCGLGLPIPEDIVLVTAGFLGARDGVPLLSTAVVMYFGILGGDALVFSLGRFGGQRFMRGRWGRRLITQEKLAKTQSAFTRWGTGVVFVARFMPGLRAPIYFSAGLLHFSFFKFLLMDGFAALISAPVFVWLGHHTWILFGDDYEAITEAVGRFKLYFLVGGLGLGLVIFLVIWRRNRRRHPLVVAKTP